MELSADIPAGRRDTLHGTAKKPPVLAGGNTPAKDAVAQTAGRDNWHSYNCG